MRQAGEILQDTHCGITVIFGLLRMKMPEGILLQIVFLRPAGFRRIELRLRKHRRRHVRTSGRGKNSPSLSAA